MPTEVLVSAVTAGLLASLACGLGALPLAWTRLDPVHHRGIGYAVAGGLMFAASVYNLLLPGLSLGGHGWTLADVLPIIAGFLIGAAFLALVDRHLRSRPAHKLDAVSKAWGGRVGLLVFLAMTFHSIPEGVAVGVGYTSDAVAPGDGSLGPTLALAIAIHNIPEGLAIGIPLRANGASIARCAWAAFLTSLPQPVAAIPAVLLAWFFEPLMPLLMAFAAGAMIFLILLELIPEALETENRRRIAWGFCIGFCFMLLMQVVL